MKKFLRAFTVIETVIILLISIAVIVAAIAVGNALLKSHYTNQLVSDMNAVVDASKAWSSETGSTSGKLSDINHLCADTVTYPNFGDQALKILDTRICGAANTGSSTNPFRGNYTVSGGFASGSTPGYYIVTATTVPEAEGQRAVSIFAQDPNNKTTPTYSDITGTITISKYMR